MSLAFDGRLITAPPVPARPAVEGESRLNIVVVFTSANATAEALKKAGNLAESLGAHISLVVPQVPYPLPLASPPVLLSFQEKRFRELASKSPVMCSCSYTCAGTRETLTKVLSPLPGRGGQRKTMVAHF